MMMNWMRWNKTHALWVLSTFAFESFHLAIFLFYSPRWYSRTKRRVVLQKCNSYYSYILKCLDAMSQRASNIISYQCIFIKTKNNHKSHWYHKSFLRNIAEMQQNGYASSARGGSYSIHYIIRHKCQGPGTWALTEILFFFVYAPFS